MNRLARAWRDGVSQSLLARLGAPSGRDPRRSWRSRPPRPSSAKIVFPTHEQPTVSIVVPVHDKVGVTLRCLQALLISPNEASFEVIVVDDDSADDTRRLADRVEGITIARNEQNLGFVHSCNRGAGLARGDYITLLNNDTEPRPHWLDEMLFVFRNFPDVGLVGSKLIYSDGILQEAGGIIWSNGDPWNYGRGADADRPEFDFTRQADYVSGAAITLDRRTWHRVGGFSPEFAPAYYEDVDLAFKVRALGQKVVYAPLSVVVHHEGTSSGTDTRRGMKRFQDVNAPVFRAKWATAIRSQPSPGTDPEMAANHRGGTGQALFVGLRSLDRDHLGPAYEAIQDMRLLQSLGYRVAVVVGSAPSDLDLDRLRRMGVEVLRQPDTEGATRVLTQRGPHLDIVYLDNPDVAGQVLSTTRRLAPRARTILRLTTVKATQPVDPAVLHGPMSADVVLSSAPGEPADPLARPSRQRRVTLAPFVVDEVDIQSVTGRDGIWLPGNGSRLSDRQAIEGFCREVMPLVRARRPETKLYVTGSGWVTSDSDRWRLTGGVYFVGSSASVVEMLGRRRLMVVPQREGVEPRGLSAHSLAYGMPQVVSVEALIAMGLRSGVEAWSADSPAEWADRILTLCEDDGAWLAMSRAAQHYAAEAFSFDKGLALMLQALELSGEQPTRATRALVIRHLSAAWTNLDGIRHRSRSTSADLSSAGLPGRHHGRASHCRQGGDHRVDGAQGLSFDGEGRESKIEPIDADALREGIVELRDALAEARSELNEAYHELALAAEREARLRASLQERRLAVPSLARLKVAGLARRGRRSLDRAIVRVTPGAVLPFLWHNPLFDAAWYLERNPDVRARRLAGERHFRRHGAAEGRDPNALFDTSWYLQRYPDVAASGINPLDHYLLYGASDGRDPSPSFDTSAYLASNPDVRVSGVDPLLHFLRFGASEGREPRPRGGQVPGAGTRMPVAVGLTGTTARGSRPWRRSHSSWRPRLEGVPVDRPIVLVIEDKFPQVDRDAGSLLTRNYIDLFQGLGYHVLFVSTHEDMGTTRYGEALIASGTSVVDATGRPDVVMDLLGELGPRISLAFLSRVNSGGAFIEEVTHHCPDARVIFNTVDLHFLREERAARLVNDRAGMYAAAAVMEREIHVARMADATIVVSDAEKSMLEAMVPGANIYWCPLMQDVIGRSCGFQDRSGVAFIGGYRHQPNVDALGYFLDDVWPLVQAALPGVSFYAIGPDMPGEMRRRTDEGFVAVGHVDDLAPWLERVRLTVAPLRYGAGVKGKILSSLAHGVPCILTPVAAEGIPVADSGALVAEDAGAFAEQIVSLHENGDAWLKQSDAALRWVDSNVSVAIGLRRLRSLLADLDVVPPADVSEAPPAQAGASGV